MKLHKRNPIDKVADGTVIAIDDKVNIGDVIAFGDTLAKVTKDGAVVFGEEFPFKRNLVSDETIREMFNNLKEHKGRTKNIYYTLKNINISHLDLAFRGKPTILLSKDEDYMNINRLSDMFNEANRMKARRYDRETSTWDYYFANKFKLAESALEKHGEIAPYTLREELYYTMTETSAFRPTNLAYIIDLFGAKSILDPSAGWGDRLLAAMAKDVRYVGVDPNTKLHPVYKEMIKFFDCNCTMICSPIETAELPDEKFDLVFTSPPYFNLEIYTDEDTQSIAKVKTERAWFDKFLTVMIDKCSAALKDGGYFVLVINQKNRRENYIKWMLDYVKLHYYGVISYSDEKLKNPQPMWIWRKSAQIPRDLYNPSIEIVEYNGIKVVRDDFLIGGSKQRGLVELIANNPGYSEYIYAGPVFGYAQIALAISAKYNKVNATVIVEKRKKLHPLTRRAQSLGAKIVEVKGGYLKRLQEFASNYAKKKGRLLLPFGLHSKEFHDIMVKNIRESWPDEDPKRIWLVAGSAVILNILYDVFPKTEFIAIQVGRKVWPDQINDRTKLVVSDERFTERAKILPPYPSVSNYDAKAWKYVKHGGKKGDYVWNVGRDLPPRPVKH